MPDHAHMMPRILPKYAVSHVVGLVKGKRVIHLARVSGKRRCNVAGQCFWAQGYFVSIAGQDPIRRYIREQAAEDRCVDRWQLLRRDQSPSGGLKPRGCTPTRYRQWQDVCGICAYACRVPRRKDHPPCAGWVGVATGLARLVPGSMQLLWCKKHAQGQNLWLMPKPASRPLNPRT